MNTKKLLMLNATAHDIPLIKAAQKNGFYVVTTGNRPDFIGHRYSNEYICADYSDYDAIIDLVKKNDICSLSAGTSDNCALTAAYVGEKLGLRGHDTYKNANIIHRKYLFKQFCNENNVISPKSMLFDDIESALSNEKLDFPLIVKPSDLAGGQGMSVVNDLNEYLQAVTIAFNMSHSKQIVVEEYMQGTEHSIFTFIVDGKIRAFCTSNEYHYLYNFMICNDCTPASHWENAVNVLIPEIERIIKLLGLVDGPLHVQYILSDGKPYIIEMMRRCPGNNHIVMVSDSSSIDWADWIIKAESGMSCSSLSPTFLQHPTGYKVIMANENGIYEGYGISQEFKPFVYQIDEWEQPGFEINDYLSNKMGVVMYHFENTEIRDQWIDRINDLTFVNVKNE